MAVTRDLADDRLCGVPDDASDGKRLHDLMRGHDVAIGAASNASRRRRRSWKTCAIPAR